MQCEILHTSICMMYYCIILVNVSLPKGGDRSKGRLLGIIPVPPVYVVDFPEAEELRTYEHGSTVRSRRVRTGKVVFSAYVLVLFFRFRPFPSPHDGGQVRLHCCCLGGSSPRLSTRDRQFFVHFRNRQLSRFGGWDFGLCSRRYCSQQFPQCSCSSLRCMPPRGGIAIGRRKA